MCAALGALSVLVLPHAPAYDAWAWIVWGREAADLDLDTTGGPSFKPLPVAATTILSLAGDAAPELWLAVARACGLAALVLAFVLAARLTGPAEGYAAPVVAGTVAVALLVLTPAADARFLRYTAQGLTEPLLVALLLGAVDRHLAGRPWPALALSAAACLLRPEAWPIAALYGLWLWRREPRRRPPLAGLAVAVLALWFGVDALASGDALSGAERARQPSVPLGPVLEDAADIVMAPVWVAAAMVAGLMLRGGERLPAVLLAGAAAWIALVCAMAVTLHYAADPRFFLPGAAVLCVLTGAGAGRLAGGALRSGPRRYSAAGALAAGLLVSVPLAAGRTEELVHQRDVLDLRATIQSDLAGVLRGAGGRATLEECGGRLAVSMRGVAIEAPMRMAWELGVPLVDVHDGLRGRPGLYAVRVDRVAAKALARAPRARQLARRGNWRVYAVGCGAALR